MRIALLSYEYPPDTGFGGIGTYTYYQAHALARLGHDVTVYAGAQKPTRRRIHDGPVQVVRAWKSSRMRPLVPRLQQQNLRWFANRLDTAVNMFAAVHRDILESSYDVVEMPECGAEGALINSLLDLPTVVRLHSPSELIMPMYDTRRLDRLMTGMVERIGMSGATALTSCSQWLAQQVSQRMRVGDPITVIPNGIDLNTFDVDEGFDIHERWQLPTGATKVFFANRLEPRKGIEIVRDVCLPILQKFEDVVFVLAGADHGEWLSRQIHPLLAREGLSKRVIGLGRISPREVRACLKQTDVFLLPSIWENAPYSLLEAMAAGKPVLASDCGGIPEVLRHGIDGLLAPTGDAPSFGRSLEKLLGNPALRTRLGRAARQRVESRFDDRRMAERSLEFYQWALHAPTPGTRSRVTRSEPATDADPPRQVVSPADWFQVPWLINESGGANLTVVDGDGNAPLQDLTLDHLAFATQILTRSFWMSAQRDDPNAAEFIKDLQDFYTDTAQKRTDGDLHKALADIALPSPSHAIFANEELLKLLADHFWHLESEPRIAEWMARCAATPDFIELASGSISLRRMLARVAARHPKRPSLDSLHALYRSPARRSAVIAADSAFLEQAPRRHQFGRDIDDLGLHTPLRQPRVFGKVRRSRSAADRRDDPETTVIIPAFCHESYVRDATRSALDQDDVQCTVIVADDCSPDGTVGAAETISDPLLSVRVNPTNLGLGGSIARALESVETEFVAILNSDDLFHPARVGKCLAALRATPSAAVAATGLAVMDARGRALSGTTACITEVGPRSLQWLRWHDDRCATRQLDAGAASADEVFRDLLAANFLVTSSNILCRTEWLRRHIAKLVPLRYCVDWRVFLEAALEDALTLVSEPLLGYRIHDSNTVWFEGEARADYVHEVNFVLADALRSYAANLERRGESAETIAETIADLLEGPVRDNGESDGAAIAWSLLSGRPAELDYPPESAQGRLATEAVSRKQLETSLGGKTQPAWLLADRIRRHPHLAASEHMARGLLAEKRVRERELSWLREQLREARAQHSDHAGLAKQQFALESRIEELRKRIEEQRDEAAATSDAQRTRLQDLEKSLSDSRQETRAALEQVNALRDARAEEANALRQAHAEEASAMRRASAEEASALRRASAEEASALRQANAKARAARLRHAMANAASALESERRIRTRALRSSAASESGIPEALPNLVAGIRRSAKFGARKLGRVSTSRVVVPLPGPPSWTNQPCLVKDLREAVGAGMDVRLVSIPIEDSRLDRDTPDFAAQLDHPVTCSSRSMEHDRRRFERKLGNAPSSTTWADIQSLVDTAALGPLAYAIARECESLKPAAVLAFDLGRQGALAAVTARLLSRPLVLRLRGRDLARRVSHDVSPQLVLPMCDAVISDSPAASEAASQRAATVRFHAVAAPWHAPAARDLQREECTLVAFGPLLHSGDPQELGSVFAAIAARIPHARLVVATSNTLTHEEVTQREALIDVLIEHGVVEAVTFRDDIGAGIADQLAARATLILETASPGTDLGVPDGAVLAAAHGTPLVASRTPSLDWFREQSPGTHRFELVSNDSLVDASLSVLTGSRADAPESRIATPSDLHLTEWRRLVAAVRSWRD